MSYHRVESEDERVRDKETIRKLKKAMVDQQEEIATLKIEMTSLKSQMATLKSQTLLVQQWNNQVMTTLCSYSIYISLSIFLTFFIILSNGAIYLLVILG